MDTDPRWNYVSDEDKERIGYKVDRTDGEFWMTFQDWIRHFDRFDICLMPEYASNFTGLPGQCILGRINPGENAPLNYADLQDANSMILGMV